MYLDLLLKKCLHCVQKVMLILGSWLDMLVALFCIHAPPKTAREKIFEEGGVVMR